MELCFCKFIAVLDIPILKVTSDIRPELAEFSGEKSRQILILLFAIWKW